MCTAPTPYMSRMFIQQFVAGYLANISIMAVPYFSEPPLYILILVDPVVSYISYVNVTFSSPSPYLYNDTVVITIDPTQSQEAFTPSDMRSRLCMSDT
jgi:hypothetical protein